MRGAPALLLALAAISLQGCVALALPVLAAGVIGKKQVDAARERAKRAQQGIDPATLPPIVTVGPPEPEALPSIPSSTPGSMTAIDRLDQSDINNQYLPFIRYALVAQAKQRQGEAVRSAVLIDQVSLAAPQAMECGNKPMLVILDLDVAPGTPAEMDIDRQTGFASLLQTLRESSIRVAWMADMDEDTLKPMLDLLREGETPVMDPDDLLAFGVPDGPRKQERRWQLARNYCVVAVAGDRLADFDELYDYLLDQRFAVKLDEFMWRGWFKLPHPITAIDSERLAISPEKKAEQ